MPVAWIVPTVTDLEHYLVAAMVDALRTAALGETQTDPFGEVMPSVTARIRNEIMSCPRNKVSATANSIPPSLKTIACLLIIEALQTRLQGIVLTDEQRRLIDDGRDYLKRIAKCDVVVEDPTDPQTPAVVQRAGGIQYSASARVCSRARLEGL